MDIEKTFLIDHADEQGRMAFLARWEWFDEGVSQFRRWYVTYYPGNDPLYSMSSDWFNNPKDAVAMLTNVIGELDS